MSVTAHTHGRVLVVRAAKATDATPPARGLIVAFHGYGQGADTLLADIMKMPGVSQWHVAAVQALHRFYTRGDAAVVASWMTRQDRDDAIADNIAYVDSAVDRVLETVDVRAPGAIVFAGFSQGAAMAYRAARFGRHRPAAIIALAGDIPPEVKSDTDRAPQLWPPVLIGVGDAEQWYTADKVDADRAFLESRGAAHHIARFQGGHEWTEGFGVEVMRFLDTELRSSTFKLRSS